MAILKKALVAAIASGAIGFTASALAQAGAAGSSEAAGGAVITNNTTSGTPGNNVPGSTGVGSATAPGGNGGATGTVANHLGTRGPAGSTSLAAAQALSPGGAVGANRRSPNIGDGATGANGQATGGNGIGSGNAESAAVAGPHATLAGVDVRDKATPVAGLSARAMARLNVREHGITARLNQAELNQVTAPGGTNPVAAG